METQAKIYLADQRGCSETAFMRSYHSFNFGAFNLEGREPFGPLHLLNDDMLRAGASLTLGVDQPATVVLLPVSGGLEYRVEQATGFAEPGQLQLLSLSAGMTYTVSNPYETEYIHFLQCWLTGTDGPSTPAATQSSFDLTHKNQLLPLFGTASATTARPTSRGFIGQFDGRREGIYRVGQAEAGAPANGVFVFVLKGVFEVQHRLLHEKDGLALWQIQDEAVEFEALSNEAILILLDLPAGN